MRHKQVSEDIDHFSITRMAFCWDIRCRKKPSFYTLEIESLAVRKFCKMEGLGSEKFTEFILGYIIMTNLFVIGGIVLQKVLIVAVEIIGIIIALIPDKAYNGFTPEQPFTFRLEFFAFKPVERLGSSNNIN